MQTLYQLADEEIRKCVGDYLTLSDDTNGFTNVSEGAIDSTRKAVILLSGINAPTGNTSPSYVVREWTRRKAIPMDVEAGITAGVYTDIRSAGAHYLEEVKNGTNGFRNWSPEFIREHAYTLPLLQHLAGVFSKAALKRQVGQVSDNSISKPAAQRLSALLAGRVVPEDVQEGEILQRLEATLEGIVRDLVGRVMLETIVESALQNAGVAYKKEDAYSGLSGVRVPYGDEWGHAAIARSTGGLMLSLAGSDRAAISAAHA